MPGRMPRMEPITAPVNTLRCGSMGQGQPGPASIALDGSGAQVAEGLPRKLEVRVTQRAADGTQTDSTQWVTLTWENTVPAFKLQIDQPNLYAGYAETEGRVCLRLTRNGEPAANVFVELQNADQKNFDVYGGLSLDSYTGFTDASGVLYLTQVPAGTYWVNAGTIAKQSRVASIEVTGESCGFDLELEG